MKQLDLKLLYPKQFGRAFRLVWNATPRWTCANLILVAVLGLVPLAALYLLKLILETIETVVTSGERGDAFEQVALLILLSALVALFGNLLQALSTWITEAQAQDVTDHMQDLLQSKSTQMDLAFFENPNYGDTFHRAQREGSSRPIQIVRGLTEIGLHGVSLVAVCGLLLSIHWVVGPVLLLAALPALILRAKYARRMFAWQRQSTPAERQADHLGWMMTAERNAREVRLFDLGGLFRERYRALRRRIRRERLRLVAWRSWADGAAEAINTLCVFGTFGFMAYRTVQGDSTFGDLVIFYAAFQRAQTHLQAMMRTTSLIYENNLFLTNVFEFIDMMPEVTGPEHPKPVPEALQAPLELRGVHFTYPGTERPVLQDINLTVRPGEVVALVGENGCGKTTLTKLICRYYDPTAGSIHFGGIDLREFHPTELRRKISVIFQDYVRYHLLTARDNIWLGRAEAPPDEDKIREAARTSGADGFIGDLPAGYDTVMGRLFDSGEELSIGQWQRLALARAIYRESHLLILDEPSSALDPKAEAEVFEQFRRLTARQTTILISHRLANVRSADRIYVIDEGRIVESGTHDELMEAGGAYRFLFEAQAKHYH